VIDTIILGDNPFYGINHRSQAYALERAQRFENIDNILQVFRLAKRHGAGGVMLSSHANAEEIIQKMLKDPELKDFHVYPHIPYLMKYVSEVTKQGMMGTAAKMLGQGSLGELLSGGIGVLKKDYYQMVKSFIDLELSKYRGARIKAVFLHNGLTDLALGLRLYDFFPFFNEYIRDKYQAIGGFGTLNLSKMAQALKSAGVSNGLVMAPYNATGFFMNPSKEASEKAVKDSDITLLAMNVLASGAIKPHAAFEYLAKSRRIRHVVLGVSSEEHIRESFALAKEFLPSSGEKAYSS
jgi:hypothetical protein